MPCFPLNRSELEIKSECFCFFALAFLYPSWESQNVAFYKEGCQFRKLRSENRVTIYFFHMQRWGVLLSSAVTKKVSSLPPGWACWSPKRWVNNKIISNRAKLKMLELEGAWRSFSLVLWGYPAKSLKSLKPRSSTPGSHYYTMPRTLTAGTNMKPSHSFPSFSYRCSSLWSCSLVTLFTFPVHWH
jgi:hypothetical protein